MNYMSKGLTIAGKLGSTREETAPPVSGVSFRDLDGWLTREWGCSCCPRGREIGEVECYIVYFAAELRNAGG